VRGSTRVTLAYGTDLDMAMPLLAAQAAASPRVLTEPAPGVALSRFAPEGYELELGYWIGDPENGTGGVGADINKRIYALVKSGVINLGHSSIDSRLLDAHITSAVARITQSPSKSPIQSS
jgi:small-conductance mechanosensitive channel